MPPPRIVWREPRAEQHEVFAKLNRFALELPAAPKPKLQLRAAEALFQAGIPTLESALTPREDAIGLLKLAAEVEHALLVQYLYAAQSVRGAAAQAIAHVGVQEMGHLVTVQNLLLALTGLTGEGLPTSLHLGRDGLRRASDRNPLPLILEQISKTALAKFVVIERPFDIPDAPLAARVAQLEQQVVALGIEPHPVYALYAAIRWIFQSDDAGDEMGLTAALGFKPGWHLADSDFVDPAIATRYASEPIEWHSIPALIIAPASNRADALAALDAVTAQGEGLPGSAASHFATFIDVLDQFENGTLPIKALPRTPTVPSQPPSEDPSCTTITNAYSALWAELFNQVYELLIVDIGWAISHPRDGAVRRPYIDICIDVMNRLIRPLSTYLTNQPLGADPLVKSGPPFGLADEQLPGTVAGFARRFTDGLSRQAQLITTLKGCPEFAADTIGRQRITAIEQIATRRLPYLPKGA
jgi:hypothetical protein